MNQYLRNILVWLAIFIFVAIGFNLLQDAYFTEPKVNLVFSEFLAKVEQKSVSKVKIRGREIEGVLNDGSHFKVYRLDYPQLIDILYKNDVEIDAVPPESKMNSFLGIFVSWFPMLLLIGVWIFFMRQMNGGGGKAFGFGKSKAKLLSEKSVKVSFAEVAGIDEAKEELLEIVDFLRDPLKFQKLGGKIPKGCLLIGPPGTGKTLLARAIAGEANVPFFSISGSDFVEMFVGVGASRVRDMFEQGKRNAPCIIFIDEIDAVGRQRGIGMGGGHDEREQTLNQMLVEMDGFDPNDGVVVIAATNREDVLDRALMRPGRFDRQIVVDNPDIKGRTQILEVHIKKIRFDAKSVDVSIIAKGTPGFSGAELANVINEAALLAARRGKKLVEMNDLEDAKDKVMMGIERKSLVMSENEKRLTAYHESGHAIVSFYSPESDPIHKATIIPRGRALGMVVRLPENDRVSLTRIKAETDIAVAMGGRVAEEIIFKHSYVTSGASSDIQFATRIATAMVREWGMSDKLGLVFYGKSSNDLYAYSSRNNNHSDHTEEVIDSEIKAIVNKGYEKAKSILEEHIDKLHILAEELLAKETLTGAEIKTLLSNDNLQKDFVSKRSNKNTTNSDEINVPQVTIQKRKGKKKEEEQQN